ncbi:MAG: hypothetical protein ACI9LM_003403 [Alteromonadaceae bacterium]
MQLSKNLLTWQTLKILLLIDDRNYLVIKMKLACHDHYEITIKDNLLVVEMRGQFDDAIAQQYIEDMYQVCELLKNKVWGSLVTYNGSALFSPKAEEALIDITKFRVQHGMIANASIIIDSVNADIQQMQLQRIYQASRITSHVFSDKNSANQWLVAFIEQKCL